MKPHLILGDCLQILPTLEPGSIDAIVTDPPYLITGSQVPLLGGGVAPRREDSFSVGNLWGDFSLAWIDAAAKLEPKHWLVFCNYKMLGQVCAALELHAEIACVFVWRKTNAPPMVRPVPHLDCEFIVWAKLPAVPYGRMKEFKSMLIEAPMLQAGCFATERILAQGSKKAAHPCQKPLSVIRLLLERLGAKHVCDPFMGTGTTGQACAELGVEFTGIEMDQAYFDLARHRISETAIQSHLPEVAYESP